MNKIVENIQENFKDSPDLIVKQIKVTFTNYIYILYLETVSDTDKINEYIIKPISNYLISKSHKNIINILPGPNEKEINNIDKIIYYLTSGFAIVIYKKEVYAYEVRAILDRGINTPDSEPSIIGPKDAFTENYQKNIGLIKRRIKNINLKIKNNLVGKYTKSTVGTIYIDGIADIEVVEKVLTKIKNIDVDGIIDSGELKKNLVDKITSFPLIKLTERPDTICNALLEGKIVVTVDNSPFMIIIPAFFADFINPIIDNFMININVAFLKFLRIMCVIVTLLTPAIYIAVINYNQETIPTSLLINFIIQRDGVPFPAIIEAIVMLIICEFLRESDVRFPNSYGSAISILGALILGEAAVSAGIVSPIMIIIIAITFITGLVFTDQDFNSSIRYWRFIFLFFTSFLGLFGIVLCILLFLIYICSLESFNKPYFYPIAPFDFNYLKSTLIKTPKPNSKRGFLISKNLTKRKVNK